MKKYFLLIILLINGIISAQTSKFAILSNLSSVRENPAITADSITRALQSTGGLNSLICLGNATPNGTLQEFEGVKYFLDSLNVRYNLLAGQSDFKQYIPGYLNIRKYFTEDNFFIDGGNFIVIGLQLIDLANYNKGHLSRESGDWLKNILVTNKDKKIILILNSEIDKIDNVEILYSLLDGYSVVKVLTPSFAKPVKKETRISRKRVSRKPEEIPFLHVFEIRNDTLLTSGYSSEDGFTSKGENLLEKIDLKDILNVRVKKENTKSVINTNSSTVSKILTYKDNLIVSNLNGTITSYNPDLTIKWQYKVEGNLVGTPVLAGDRLIIATTLGEIFIIDAETKTELQSIGTNCEIVSPLLIIEYKGDKELLIPKTGSSKDALVFSSSSGEIYCYDLETLQELWINSDSKSPLVRNTIIAGNKLVFKNCDGKIFCIDSRTGLLNWRWGYNNFLADTKTDLIFNGKQIITITNNNSINGIDLLLGVTEWQSDGDGIIDFSKSAESSDTIIALTNNNLTFYDSRKGKELRQIKLRDKDFISFLKPDNLPDKQYLISEENDLYKLDKLKTLQKIGNIGGVSIVSFFTEGDNNLYFLTIDGQLLNIKSN